MNIKNTICGCIGKTPMVRITSISNNSENINVYGKLEYLNPGLSIKDRAAIKLIDDVEKKGLLKKGDTIVESTSGNMGHSLAMICASKGYKLLCLVDPKTPSINISIYKAFGANILMIKEKDENGGYQKMRIKKAKELGEKIGFLNLNQYENISCINGNYDETGKEIYESLEGKVDYLIASVSTGGHLSGTAKYLRDNIGNKKITIIAVEPDGSVIFGGIQKPYKQNGTGLSFKPKNYISSLVDIEVKCNDRNAFSTCRKIARTDGIFIGGSSGSVLWVVNNLLKMKKIRKNSNIVCLLPDSGMKYINTIYDNKV